MNNLKRLSWPIVFFLVAVLITAMVGIGRTNLEVVVFKFLIFCPALALVHLSRKVMFPYIDLAKAAFSVRSPNDVGTAIRDAAVILGVFLYYVVLTYALTQAI